MTCLRFLVLSILVALTGVTSLALAEPLEAPPAGRAAQEAERQYLLERVDDAAIAQIYAGGFERLDLREKVLIWHLYNAALAGRDIFYDQRYVHNLDMRATFEEILTHGDGVDSATLEAIHRYAKLFWINTGPYNNLTARKFTPWHDPRGVPRGGARSRGGGGPACRPATARVSTRCSTASNRCSSTRPSIPS